MAKKNVEKVLDPMGDTVQGLLRGKRGAGRLEVAVLWPQIAAALDAGMQVKTIWEALSQNGLVSVKRRGFAKQVQARREGAKAAGAAAKPGAEPRLLVVNAGAACEAKPAAESRPLAVGVETNVTPAPGASGQVDPGASKAPEIKPGIPRRPWRTGPYEPPNPNAVFKPRDPLADDD